MRGILKRLENKKGFTLVELLIVIAIIGVLAAIIIPNVSGLAGSGKKEAGAAELSTLQTAMDTMMAKGGLTAVAEVTVATKDMKIFPVGHPLYPDFLRNEFTKGTYTCSATGLVAVVTTGYE